MADREMVDAVRCNRTCAKHRVRFVEVLEQAGLKDAAAVAHVEQGFVVAVINAYPHRYMMHVHENTCLGCDLEGNGPQCVDWAIVTLLGLAQKELGVQGLPSRRA